MIIEIRGLNEFDVRVSCGDLVRIIIDSIDKNAGEQEIGEDDNSFVAKPRRMFQARLNQREGHA